MNYIFVIFGLVNCALSDACKLFNQFEELHAEVNVFTNAHYGFVNDYLFQVRKGHECQLRERSKAIVCTFLTQHCKPFLLATYQCTYAYLKKTQIMLAEHISKIKSGDLSIECQAEITQSNNILTQNQESTEEYEQKLFEFLEACASFETLETLLCTHKQIVTLVKTKCEKFHGAHLDYMGRGRMLASQILFNLGIVAKEGNTDLPSAMEGMSLEDVQD